MNESVAVSESDGPTQLSLQPTFQQVVANQCKLSVADRKENK